ncbi:hypothetical protein [Falsirhodobacter sp. 1013]|uniref:hypothetical protein n=1 Tax=Falsirhodobacter sp. 1013 TaxID=3417566 RepID=UPI003EBE04DF
MVSLQPDIFELFLSFDPHGPSMSLGGGNIPYDAPPPAGVPRMDTITLLKVGVNRLGPMDAALKSASGAITNYYRFHQAENMP